MTTVDAQTFDAMVARSMSEDAWLTHVLALARHHGWRSAHFRPARTDRGWRTPVSGDGKGFPDLVMVRGTTLICAELKAQRGRLTPEQEAWLVDLSHAQSVCAEVWRPGDRDEVLEALR